MFELWSAVSCIMVIERNLECKINNLGCVHLHENRMKVVEIKLLSRVCLAKKRIRSYFHQHDVDRMWYPYFSLSLFLIFCWKYS